MAGVVVIGLIGLITDQLLRALHRRMFRYLPDRCEFAAAVAAVARVGVVGEGTGTSRAKLLGGDYFDLHGFQRACGHEQFPRVAARA